MDAQRGRVPAVFPGERPSVVLCVVHDVEVAHLILCVRPGHQVGLGRENHQLTILQRYRVVMHRQDTEL